MAVHLGQANLRSCSEIQPRLRSFLQANFPCTEQLPQVMMFTFKLELSRVSVLSFECCMRYASDVVSKSSRWLYQQAWLLNAFFGLLWASLILCFSTCCFLPIPANSIHTCSHILSAVGAFCTEVALYCSGFVCTPFSLLHSKSKLLGDPAAKTLAAVLRHAKCMQPCVPQL